MKFATFILTALAVAVATSAVEVGAPVRRAAVDVELEARACASSPACTCTGHQRQFCGNESPLVGCINGHVYECNGSTGKTCDYGIRNSCVNCGSLQCSG